MIIPTSGRLVLQKIKEEEPVSKGGLILPSSQPKQDRYRVMRISSSDLAIAALRLHTRMINIWLWVMRIS